MPRQDARPQHLTSFYYAARKVVTVNADKLPAHLRIDRYGDFWLTDAIRPAQKRHVTPREGYRLETYRDPRNSLRVPVLAAAVSREKLFDVFLDMLEPLGAIVDVVVETSHERDDNGHHDLFRERIDLAVLKSCFCDFEDLLLHDGCAGVAVLSTTKPVEVQFDEHKLLLVYGSDLKPYQRVLISAGVPCDDRMKLITEGEHLHSSDSRYRQEFEVFCHRLAVGEAAERVSW
jgi:hypothetical protein